MRVTCPICQGQHAKWDCKQKAQPQPKEAQPPPVDAKPRRGRPISDAPKSPRAEYQRELMRKRRAAAKLKDKP